MFKIRSVVVWQPAIIKQCKIKSLFVFFCKRASTSLQICLLKMIEKLINHFQKNYLLLKYECMKYFEKKKIYLLIFVLIFIYGNLSSQVNIEIIELQTDTFTLQLIPQENIDNLLFTNLQFTVSWVAESVDIIMLDSAFNMQRDGNVVINGNMNYQKFVALPDTSITWEINEIINVIKFTYSGNGENCGGVFEISTDDWVQNNNGAYYIEFWGDNYTGEISNAEAGFINTIDISFIVEEPLCFDQAGGNITSQIIGGLQPYTYNWSGGFTSPDLNNITAGTYQLTIFDINSCSQTDSIIINEPDELYFTEVIIQHATIDNNDGSISAIATGGTPTLEYSIDNINFSEDGNFDNLQSDWYSVICRDTNNCNIDTSIFINQQNKWVDIGIFEENDIYEVLLKSKFEINNLLFTNIIFTLRYPVNTVSPVIISAYFDIEEVGETVNNNDFYYQTYGCIPNEYVSWQAEEEIKILEFTVESIGTECGGSFELINDDFTHSINSDYFVEIFGLNYTGILYEDSAGYVNSLVLDYSKKNVKCNGKADGIITINISGGQSPYSYLINNNLQHDDNIFSNLDTGVYNITVKDMNDCTSSYNNIVITEPTQMTDSVTTTSVHPSGADNGTAVINVSGGIIPYKYSLDNIYFQPMDSFINLAAGDYTVFINDSNNCELESDFTIGGDIFIPNCFTPNGDGFNDDFEILNIKSDVELRMQIFDEYSVEVFSSFGNSWSGEKINGDRVKSGEIYLYKIVIDSEIYKGWVYVKE